MEEEYDAIVLGTGLKECIISGLLSLYERFRPGQKPPQELGASRDYNVDLVPKFIMANGNLVKVLIHTDVTKYLEFKAVDGSFVLNKARVEKVPATDWEAIKSPLLGFFEKRRVAKFLGYVQQYDPADPQTYKGVDLRRTSMADLYAQYGLDAMSVDFLGHAVALHSEDSYMRRPALESVLKIKLYYESMMRYEGLTSPYIYPLYGLGELPQAFARLSAVYGGTYMLARADAEVVFDPDTGRAIGVCSEGQVAKAKFVVGDPSYFPDKLILPQKQVGRRSDIYVFCCSYSHNVAPKNKWLAFVSTTVETADPHAELAAGLQLLGRIDEKFVEVVDVYEPLESGQRDGCFISRGYDATSHFETEIEDVLDLYLRITGKQLDLSSESLAKRQETRE